MKATPGQLSSSCPGVSHSLPSYVLHFPAHLNLKLSEVQTEPKHPDSRGDRALSPHLVLGSVSSSNTGDPDPSYDVQVGARTEDSLNTSLSFLR